MRWFEAALAVRGPARRRQGRRLGVAVLAAALALATTGAAQPATGVRAGVFTGYGFESCNAPTIDALDAWLQSPYRAVGIYIGGVNRTCANAGLTSDWVAGALAGGWNLIPTYVGLQAPCISNQKRARFTAANAQSQGVGAADDAIAAAALLGLPAGSPIYYDMEAYALKDAACTRAVQAFVTAWVAQLHARGYVAGVYGSAASTMRDMQALANTPASPDSIWIANWNGNESVFGDPYVSDALWTNHQRIHQYRGDHKETWGGVTINIDSDFVDGPVVSGAATVAPPPEPVGLGSLSTPDGMASVTWPAGAVDDDTNVQIEPNVPGVTLPGFGTGGYGVELQATSFTKLTRVRAFAAPLTLKFAPRSGRLAPVFSTNGTVWKHVPQLVGDAIGPGARTGYAQGDDRSFVIQTTVSGWFALVPDRIPPAPPGEVSARFVGGELAISWRPSTDRSSPVAGYLVTLTNAPVAELPRRVHGRRVDDFHPRRPSVYRVLAFDAAGNESRPSKPVVVLPSSRPRKLPKAIPAWAWRLAKWDHRGTRPDAPKQVPEWFWRWAKWQALPFHLRGS
jgi:hypothetical protein